MLLAITDTRPAEPSEDYALRETCLERGISGRRVALASPGTLRGIAAYPERSTQPAH